MNTKMVLLPSDVERIESLGYRREEFAVLWGGLYRLRNVSGRCFFYRDGCAIYECRPIGCSMYPIVIDVETGEVLVDWECPLASETREEELERARGYARAVLRELRSSREPTL